MKSVVISGTGLIGSKSVANQSSLETQGLESSAVQFVAQPRERVIIKNYFDWLAGSPPS
jgi:hypothetical protein